MGSVEETALPFLVEHQSKRVMNFFQNTCKPDGIDGKLMKATTLVCMAVKEVI
ncbi:MAG: hypothetical protein ACLR7W_17370 [Ruminococcus sp.]|uniref:hypothetical protein n=1 Tax=Ruminococcus sp. RTP21484sp1_RTP31023st1_H8_RTP31023_210422 TaxID=3141611 RepID=UPI0034A2A666